MIAKVKVIAHGRFEGHPTRSSCVLEPRVEDRLVQGSLEYINFKAYRRLKSSRPRSLSLHNRVQMVSYPYNSQIERYCMQQSEYVITFPKSTCHEEMC